MQNSAVKNSRGVALLLVTFVVALASIVVINLSYSTYMAARANSVVERSLFAEYLMKSASNIASAYLLADKDFLTGNNIDGPKDTWAQFRKGSVVPLVALGIAQPGVTLSLELIADNQKFPIKPLVTGNIVDVTARGIFVRLFQKLGFDNDLNELETNGKFKGKHFAAEEMVANLIDYIDEDSDSYADPTFVSGIESQLPKNFFPNKAPDWISQLRIIPGFTANRMRKLEPLLTPYGLTTNVNFTPIQILESLSTQIGKREVEQIIEAREGKNGPLSGNGAFANIVTAPVKAQIGKFIDYESSYFQVISKVEYGVKAYFMRAILYRDPSSKEIRTVGIQFF